MPEYLAPGVYVEEIDTGSKPIEGVSTSTAGMVGVTERGPVDVPILITSFGEFRRWFGEYLHEIEFSNANGFHCYLPHAVEGFFVNGGKRVYVTRVLRPEAGPSLARLYDRGGVGAVESVLLRTAALGTGTAVNPPFISVLAPGGLAAPSSIRIGTGSRAEYRQVVGTVASRHLALSAPLMHRHVPGPGVQIREFTRIVQERVAGTDYGPFDLSVAVAAGSTEITLDETLAGDAAALAGAIGPGIVLEIGPAPHSEYRFVTNAVANAGQLTLELDTPLQRGHPDTEAAIPLELLAAPTNDTPLSIDALAGQTIVYGDDLTGFAGLPLVQIDGPDPEVRGIGQLQQVPLTRGAYGTYARGTQVEQFASADDDRTINAVAAPPPAQDTVAIQLGGVLGLAPGQEVTLDPGGVGDVRVIRTVDEVAGTVAFTAPLSAAMGAGSVLNLRGALLTADVEAGSVTLPLDNRLGLSVGDVLRIGGGAGLEYVEIAAISGARGAAPDAGTVVLSAPVGAAHAVGSVVRRQVVTPAAGPHHPAYLILDATPGALNLFVNDDDGFTAGDVVRVTTPEGRVFLHVLSGNAAALAPLEVELQAPLERNHEAGAAIAQREELILVQALDAGHWGDRLRVSIEDEAPGLVSGARMITPPVNATTIGLTSLTGVEPGTVLELSGPNEGDPVIGPLVKVTTVDRSTGRVGLNPGLTPAQEAQIAGLPVGAQPRIRSREFRLTVRLMRRPDPGNPAKDDVVVTTELFPNLSMDPRHSRYFATVVGDINGPLRLEDRRPEGASWYIRMRDLEAVAANREAIRLGPEALVDTLPSGRTAPARHALAGGDDAIGLIGDPTYVGANAPDPDDRTGLQTLRNLEEISIVACPGRTSTVMQGALISHCEELRYRFAVLDARQAPNDSIADVRAQRQQFDTRYASIYHPWLLVPHPFPPSPAFPPPTYTIPPSGHVVGVYARTDIERGVHKAPANEVVRGVIGLRRSLSKGEHDILNPFPVNINVIRDFRPNNRGIRVWGGRVITSDSDWKYVNVRRLLIFIEASLDRGLQWVVFEPNAEPLWARVRRTISNFLTVVWRNGALEGTSTEEAYFVKCDRTTMTQTEIDSGQLICVIGVAPVKPAEFVIIRIGLWTAHAES